MKDIRTQWKALAAAKEITREDIAALCLYRTLFVDKDAVEAKARLFKSFAPITNKIKLENGAIPRESLRYALNSIKYSHVLQWLDEDDRVKMLELAKATLMLGVK